MNELRRMAYLNALGVDCYVSRTQLPGAAVTRRLVDSLTTSAAPKNREVEATRARARAHKRYGTPTR